MKLFYAVVMASCLIQPAAAASCEGNLICSNGEYVIDQGGESIWTFDEIGRLAVSSICSIGRHCRVIGTDAPCNEECALLIHITAVKSDGGIPAKLQHECH